ncbi:serine/threonine-protein kinase HipA [Paludibacterium purpuratum]|uniref:Serine/threonine-protein kinase HipA n=2 Tax=Paludibacterium purpuratum TaxID=1144873 RepID=A0A4R7B361_9NEIS|nr:serine/threonine-protein kinase HipA [Paludibacterium purpuratum]
MRMLNVYYNGWGERFLLGRLAQDRHTLMFEYSPEAIERDLSLSPLKLPLRTAGYSRFPDYQEYLPGLIADALPDGWGRLVMDRFFATKGMGRELITVLDRLAFIGDRAMGALSFEPETEHGLEPADVNLLTIAREVQEVKAGEASNALRELALMGGSPQGARPKVLLQYDRANDRVSTDTNAAGEPWLVKFPGQGEDKEACALEYCYSLMARDCGLDMPETAYFDLADNLAAFGIKRFDRHHGERVPILTMAGVLDDDFRIPACDYDSTLMPLVMFLTNDQREVFKAFERCVFNIIFNNRDDHTKNFSFLLNQSQRWELAPAYDLTYCPGPSGEHQLAIRGEARHPGREQLLAMVKEHRLARTAAEQCIEKIAAVAHRFDEYVSGYGIRRSTVAEIERRIGDNALRCLSR